MIATELEVILQSWQLAHSGEPLMKRVDRMIQPALLHGYFGTDADALVSGIQYHLGGEQDTRELATLAAIKPGDYVLDVCSYLGGPAIQLATEYGCKVTGIDLSDTCVTAAQRIANLCGLAQLVKFRVADAGDMPFPNNHFTVVWGQCSLEHDEAWLMEFDRVLAPGGRMALTFAIRREHPDRRSPRWSLAEVVSRLRVYGYVIDHAEDISERDIEIGWKRLIQRLSERDSEYAAALGQHWVDAAHQIFVGEIGLMRIGQWGNGRIVATKPTLRG